MRIPIEEPASETTRRRLRRLICLVAAAVQLVLLAVYYWPRQKLPLGDERLYLRAVDSILQTGSSQLDVLWPPLYAWFLAPLVALADGEIWLVQAVQIVLWLSAIGLLGLATSRWTGRETAGWLAALLAVAYPPLAAFSHYLWPEVVHLLLLLGAALLLDLSRSKPAAAVGAGLLLALCIQTKALVTVFVPFVLAGLWFGLPRSRRVSTVLALLVALTLGLLPSLLDADRRGDRWKLSRSGWFNLWVGLGDVSRHEFEESIVADEYQRYLRSARSSKQRDRLLREKVLTRIEERGVVRTFAAQLGRQYFRLFDKDSFLTNQLPGGAAARGDAGYRGTPAILASAIRAVSYVSWGAILVLASWGIVLFPYRERPEGYWILAFLLIQCGLFLWLHVKTRYRIQMLPALLLFAAYALEWGRVRRYTSQRVALEASRAMVATGLSAAALWLAFGAELA